MAPTVHKCQIKHFWGTPNDLCRSVMNIKEAREELIYHQAQILKNGEVLRLRAASLGAGVMEISIRQERKR